jgi:hypothetical protein
MRFLKAVARTKRFRQLMSPGERGWRREMHRSYPWRMVNCNHYPRQAFDRRLGKRLDKKRPRPGGGDREIMAFLQIGLLLEITLAVGSPLATYNQSQARQDQGAMDGHLAVW